MYVKQYHNLPSNKLGKITYYQKVQILTAYLEVCGLVKTKPNTIYKVDDVDRITVDDLKYIISFITIYNNKKKRGFRYLGRKKGRGDGPSMT